VVIGLVVAPAVALRRDGHDDTAAIRDEPAATSTTSRPTTTTTVAITTTSAPTTSATHAPTTSRPSAPSTTISPRAVPGAVTVIHAEYGAGSGEITVQWDAVAGATGYRVLRSDAGSGPFAVAADYDVATGHATRVEDHITVWHPTDQGWLQYIEYGESRVRWFYVVAYNAAGDAPPSAVVSASSPQQGSGPT
jgi:hypothetical protein